MNRTFIRPLALLVLSAAIFSGCKKNKDDDSLAVTKENLVGTYVTTSIKLKYQGQTSPEMVDTFYPYACEKDDETILKSDMKVTFKDAGTTCTPSPSENTADWSISGSKVTIDGDEYTVTKLTKGQLIAEEDYSSVTPGAVMIYVYSRK